MGKQRMPDFSQANLSRQVSTLLGNWRTSTSSFLKPKRSKARDSLSIKCLAWDQVSLVRESTIASLSGYSLVLRSQTSGQVKSCQYPFCRYSSIISWVYREGLDIIFHLCFIWSGRLNSFSLTLQRVKQVF